MLNNTVAQNAGATYSITQLDFDDVRRQYRAT